MDLDLALRTTASIRSFRADPVSNDLLFRILDRARFAGSGGNRQGWRVLVVKDGAVRRRLREIYIPIFAEYIDGLRRGLVSYSPEWTPGANPPPIVPNEFADHLDRVPVLLVVLAELGTLAITDRDVARPSIVAGASIYPFVQNILLAARGEGLGGVLTTMLCRAEPEVAALLHIPPTHAMAAMIALGFPEHQPTHLKRRPVSSFTTLDRFDGPRFAEAESDADPHP